MPQLENPGLSPESARQKLYDNLQQGGTLVWYDDAADSATILDYVLRIMGLNRSDLLVSDFGYGIASDESVAVIRLRGAAGAAICVKPMTSEGIQRVNRALEIEHEETMAALSKGEFTGNLGGAHAKYSVIQEGAIHPDFEGSDVFDYINGSDVVHITGIGLADD